MPECGPRLDQRARDRGCQADLALREIRLADDSVIRFVRATDGRGDGVSAFDVAVQNPETFLRRAHELGCVDAEGRITACGTRIYAHAA